MARLSLGVVLALGSLLASGFFAGADLFAQSTHMGPALEALAMGDRGGAEAGFERVLHDRRALAGDVAEAHRQLAGLQHASGDNTSAEVHAASAVAINPTINPPETSSEGLRLMFTRARQSQGGQRASVEINLPEHLSAARVTIARLRAMHVPRNFPGRMGVRCVVDGTVVAARDFEASARAGEFSIDALAPNASLRCVAVLATTEGVVFDRRTVNLSVGAPRSGIGGLILGLGGAALGVALVVTAIVLALSSGDDPNLGVSLGAPRVVP